MSPQGNAGTTVTTGNSKVLAALRKRAEAKGGSVFVGVLKDATYTGGESVAQVLFWNEYGTTRKTEDGKIQMLPPRPILRTAAGAHKKEWREQYLKFLASGMDEQAAAKAIGEVMQGDIKAMFPMTKMMFRRNAPSTVKKKGFDHPLVESGHMEKNSISYEIRDGKK